MSMIVLKQEEQKLKEDQLSRQTQQLETRMTSLLEEREELDLSRKDLNKNKEGVETAIKTINDEREIINQMQSTTDMERAMLKNEKDGLERRISEMKTREDQLLNKMRSMGILREKLQQLNERMREEMKNKMIRLEQNKEDVLKLLSLLEQKHVVLGKQKEHMSCYTETLEGEKEGLKVMMSESVTQRQEMGNQLKQEAFLERRHLLELKAELKKEREGLDRESEMMNKEKLDLDLTRSDILTQSDTLEQQRQDIKEEREKLEITKSDLQVLKEHADIQFEVVNTEEANIKDLTLHLQTEKDKLDNIMSMIVLKQEEQKLKEDQLSRQTQQLETRKTSLLEEREELDLSRKDLNKKKEEVETAMKTINDERKIINQMQSTTNMERAMLKNEKDGLERRISEMKTREDQLLNKMRSMGILRGKLQQLNERMREEMKNKMIRLEQNKEDRLKLLSLLDQKHDVLDKQKEHMSCYAETLEGEREGLKIMMSESVTQRKEMGNQQKQEAFLETRHLLELRAELKKEREGLDRESEMMNKEKLDLELMTSGILKQSDTLEQQTQDMKEEREKLEITKSDLQVLKEHADIQFEVIHRQKANIKDLTLHLQKEKDKLDNNMSMIVLKQEEQTLKEDQQVLKEKLNKNDTMTVKFDKAVQAEVLWQTWHEEPYVEKDCLYTHEDFKCMVVMQPDLTIQTEENSQQKFKGDKHDLKIKNKHLKTDIEGLLMVKEDEEVQNKQLSALEQDHLTDKKMSKRDCLRTIWKDTKMERKEIYQLKSMSHEMRNNLEKRLKVINQFVRRPWLQEKESLEKKLNLELGKDLTSQSDWKIDRTMLDLRQTQVQQLKAQKLSEIVKLSDKEKVLKTITTSNKDQTFKVNITTEDGQVTKGQASAKLHEEQTNVREKNSAPETSVGLLCQLQHYYRCCCPCCACCKEVCQD
ncbi:trichohyalin-like [Eleginops maclovinus]|uniref:trichohyalin-like n=1 Tax=Eleginops maclovinus TaxID=56733 RepID=UPI003080C2DA